MASERWPQIHRKWSIKILFWIIYLSFYLATAKIKYEKPKTKNRDIHLLVIKENWLSGSADRARQARRGHGFHTEPKKIIGNLRNPILKINQYEFQLGYLRKQAYNTEEVVYIIH